MGTPLTELENTQEGCVWSSYIPSSKAWAFMLPFYCRVFFDSLFPLIALEICLFLGFATLLSISISD